MATPAQSELSQQELVRRLKDEAETWNQWWMAVGPVNRAQIDLQCIDLKGANLQDRKLCDANLSRADLRRANLRRADLSGATLGMAKMDGAFLGGANLTKAKLHRVNLYRANLQDVQLNETELLRTNLRETNLRGTDLSVAKPGLLARQLAGADLTGAKLPEPLEKLYEKLGSVSEISDSAKKLFLALLAACLYSWLTIATTKDVDLITNRASSPLPIIQTAIPIVGFYVVAPIILLCVYFYFHFYLQKLWEELAHLPAIFPDGKPLHQRADPWLFNDLVRAHFSKLRKDRPFLSNFQHGVSVLLAWWLVPATLFLFWLRYLPRHDHGWTHALASIVALSIAFAIQLHRLAKETLRRHERTAFIWKPIRKQSGKYTFNPLLKRRRTYIDLVRLIALVFISVTLSRAAINATPQSPVASTMRWFRYSLFASLTNANISIKPPNWRGKDEDLDLVESTALSGTNLRYASLDGAFAAKIFLFDCDLHEATLMTIDLRQSLLLDVDLTQSVLAAASLTEANFRGSNLSGATLLKANIKYANLRDTKGLNAAMVKEATNWTMAYFDGKILRELGLPPDHNDALEAYRESASQEPFDSWEQKWSENKAKAAKDKPE